MKLFTGDAAFNAVNSNAVTLAVTTPGFTTTVLSRSAPATATAPNAPAVTVRLTSAATPPSGPTGSVVLTATPTGGSPTIPATQALAAGGTTTSVILFSAGTYTLTATYALLATGTWRRWRGGDSSTLSAHSMKPHSMVGLHALLMGEQVCPFRS